jgi:hypothetical protein
MFGCAVGAKEVQDDTHGDSFRSDVLIVLVVCWR